MQMDSSIGLHFFTPELVDVETVLKDVDTSMYRAKKAGKGRIVIYDMGDQGFNVIRKWPIHAISKAIIDLLWSCKFTAWNLWSIIKIPGVLRIRIFQYLQFRNYLNSLDLSTWSTCACLKRSIVWFPCCKFNL